MIYIKRVSLSWLFVCLLYSVSWADFTLLSWDNGSVHTWPGWTWYSDASGFGEKGWISDDAIDMGGNWYPRSHEKTDYVNYSDASIDNVLMPPYKTSGKTLKITKTSGANSAAWWWLFGNNFDTFGYADNTTNRLEFYAYYTGLDEFVNTGASTILDWSLHFATYLCWPNGGNNSASCPVEAIGQHWYHHLTAHNDGWIKHQINRHPDHQRDGSPIINPTDNPASPKAYFQYMNTFYFETETQASAPTYRVSDFIFRTETQAENEISISNLWVGYWPATDKWEIGFPDPSFGGSYGDASISTFEIRYSTSPITNENFTSATIIEPEYFEYGSTNQIRRPNSWVHQAWTRFTIDNAVESGNDTIYFAVKDVSATANGDGHNAPSSNVRTISYILRSEATSDTTPNDFSFTDNTGVALSTVIYSNSIQVLGIDNTTSITSSGTGCSYQVNGAGNWLTTGGDNVALNDNVAMKTTSSGSYNTEASCTLTLNGNVSDTWYATTLAAVESPVAPRFTGSSMTGGWR